MDKLNKKNSVVMKQWLGDILNVNDFEIIWHVSKCWNLNQIINSKISLLDENEIEVAVVIESESSVNIFVSDWNCE